MPFHALHVEESNVKDFARTRFPFIPESAPDAAVTVRTAVSDMDRQAAFDLLVRGYGRYQWVLPSAALIIRSADMFQLDVRFRQRGVMVAEAAGRVVGAALCHFKPHEEDPVWPRRWASVRAAAMAPGDGSFALGRELIEGCARAARAHGAAALCLHLAEMSARGRDAEALGLVRAPALDLAVDAQPAAEHGWPVRAYVLSLE
jgi:hypothetical protein